MLNKKITISQETESLLLSLRALSQSIDLYCQSFIKPSSNDEFVTAIVERAKPGFAPAKKLIEDEIMRTIQDWADTKEIEFEI